MKTEVSDLAGVLAVLADAVRNGMFVSPHRNSPTNAFKVLRPLPGFPPNVGRADLDALLQEGNEQGLIEAAEIRTRERKCRLTWLVTEEGRLFLNRWRAPNVTQVARQSDREAHDRPSVPRQTPTRTNVSSGANLRDEILSRLSEVGLHTPAIQAAFIVQCMTMQHRLNDLDDSRRAALRKELVFALLDDADDGGSYFHGEVGTKRAVAILGALDAATRRVGVPQRLVPSAVGAPGAG